MLEQKRPLVVTLAVSLIFITLIIVLLRTVLFHPSAFISVKALIPLISMIVTIVLSIMILHGRNWARMLFIVLFFLWIPLPVRSALLAWKAGELSVIEAFDGYGHILFYIIAVFLLLKRTSADFCNAKTKINPNFFTLLFWIGIFILLFLDGFINGIVTSIQSEIPIISTGLLHFFGSQYSMLFLYDVPLCGILVFHITSFGIPAIIYAEIYFFISLYRCWSILQGSTARTSPGKAVGFLFIPFFNLYWIFVAIRGLAKDANEFLHSKNINDKKISVGLSVGLSLATCILLLMLLIIPVVSVLVAILQTVLMYQWAKFFNYTSTTLGVD